MILLKNVLLNDRPAHILVDGGRFSRISQTPFSVPGAQEVDASGKAIIPGFLNMHTHAAMILLRGIHEDLNLYDWLSHIWKIEAGLDKDFIYWSTKVACLEMIKSGTTTFNDQYWFCPHTRQAALEMGMRPVVSFIFLDNHNAEMVQRQREACQRLYQRTRDEGWDPVHFAISIHSVYTVSEENVVWANNFALEHGLKVHLHLAETAKEDQDCRKAHDGLSPTAYFDHLGILGPHVIAAHSLHLDDDDIGILGKRQVNCVHNINSNLKLSSGFRFRYNELRDAGANVCLGTDGAASSNNLDLLEHMKNTALLQKAWRENPNQMPLQELFDCASVHGAKALGLDSGVIREGALADFSLVDIRGVAFLSPGSMTANLVYAAHSDVITDMMVEGRWVMRDRRVPGEQEVLEGARSVLKQIKTA